ncbi:hypothetical protein IAD21_02978 [Abditibacteriota bacterium]|nr:hypothetical protein IAD21_02978 [Abditibacteriota bacterium]
MNRFLVLGTVTLSLVASALGANSYSTYHNARFGYSVLYPANLVSPRPESQNGDGRIFKSSDGHGTLTVWGENNIFDRTLKAQMNTAKSDWAKDKGHITYWKMGSGFYVLSGLTGGEIFYEKTIPIRGGFATMLWQYPKSQKAKFDAAVTRTTREFGLSRRVSENTFPSRAQAPRVALRASGTNDGGY